MKAGRFNYGWRNGRDWLVLGVIWVSGLVLISAPFWYRGP